MLMCDDDDGGDASFDDNDDDHADSDDYGIYNTKLSVLVAVSMETVQADALKPTLNILASMKAPPLGSAYITDGSIHTTHN